MWRMRQYVRILIVPFILRYFDKIIFIWLQLALTNRMQKKYNWKTIDYCRHYYNSIVFLFAFLDLNTYMQVKTCYTVACFTVDSSLSQLFIFYTRPLILSYKYVSLLFYNKYYKESSIFLLFFLANALAKIISWHKVLPRLEDIVVTKPLLRLMKQRETRKPLPLTRMFVEIFVIRSSK